MSKSKKDMKSFREWYDDEEEEEFGKKSKKKLDEKDRRKRMRMENALRRGDIDSYLEHDEEEDY